MKRWPCWAPPSSCSGQSAGWPRSTTPSGSSGWPPPSSSTLRQRRLCWPYCRQWHMQPGVAKAQAGWGREGHPAGGRQDSNSATRESWGCSVAPALIPGAPCHQPTSSRLLGPCRMAAQCPRLSKQGVHEQSWAQFPLSVDKSVIRWSVDQRNSAYFSSWKCQLNVRTIIFRFK